MNKRYGKVFCGLIILCMLLSSVFIMGFVMPKASAESGGKKFSEYTDYDELIGSEITIQKYAESMSGKILNASFGEVDKYASTVKRAPGADNIMRMTASESDPIVKIVPDELFKTANETVHMGKAYGFFVNTTELQPGVMISNVYVFDFFDEYQMVETKDHAKFKISPLFQREFVYFSSSVTSINTRLLRKGQYPDIDGFENNGMNISTDVNAGIVVPLPYFYASTNYVFAESNRYRMTDVVNTISLFNDQHLNEGAVGYVAKNDLGRFIIQQDLSYKAKIYDVNDNAVGNALEVLIKYGFDKGVGKLKGLVPGLYESLEA